MNASFSAIVADVGSIVTGGISWIGSFVGAITSHPLLLLMALVPIVGLGAGLLKRLFSVN